MTAPTGIGQYVRPQTQARGDRVQAQQMKDRPMLLWVREIKHINRTQYNPNGGDGVIVDLIDLATNTAYIEVMWMAGAIVDGLRPFVADGNAYPTVIKEQTGSKNNYNAIEPITDQVWLDHITANFPALVNLITQTRAAKEHEWAQAMAQQAPPAPPAVPVGPPANLAPAAAAGPAGPPAMGATAPPPVQQPAPVAPPAPAAVAPPQAPPAAPTAPAAPPQQYAAPAYQPPAAAPAAPAQAPAAPPQAPGIPAPPAAPPVATATPGTVTNDQMAALQAKLDAIG